MTAPADRTAEPPAVHAPAPPAGAETGPRPSALVHSPAPDPEGYLTALILPIAGIGGRPASTIVDVEVYPAVARWSWYLTDGGYVARTRALPGGKTEKIRLHRLLMGCLPGDGLEIDHINRNPLDNRRANLRVATRAIQLANREPSLIRSARPRPGDSRANEPLSGVCRNGHERTPENTEVGERGVRRCLICRRAAGRVRDARRRAAKRSEAS